MSLTATEIIEHPAFEHVIRDLPPTKKGQVPVAKGRGGPFNIAYEVHGSGSSQIVWIMGLGTFQWYWQRQTQDFGHDQGSKYSCLTFDNRGMGASDKPILLYSTSEMAKDVLELLDQLGWATPRSLHIVGISMGGMIAQELAFLQPDRIASLSLISTAAQLVNTIGYFNHLKSRIEIFLPKSIEAQLREVKSRISESWLSEPDDYREFPTNGDRVAAQDLKKRQDKEGFTRKGFLCQAMAVGLHKKTTTQLRQIAGSVGGQRIQIMHGTIDNLITVPHAEILYNGLGGEDAAITKTIFEGRGHYLPYEERKEFKRLMEVFIAKTEAL